MNTRTKRGIAVSISAVALLAGTASQVSAAAAEQPAPKPSDPVATPAAYVDYLRQSHEEGAAAAAQQFQQLPKGDQEKFVGYLHDPSVLKSFLDEVEDQKTGVSALSRSSRKTASLRDGDITVGQERTVSGASARKSKPLGKGNHEVKYNTYMKMFGVKVIKLSLWVNFHSNGKDITKANYAEAGKKNLTGVMSISAGTPKKSLSKWGWCERGHCTRGHNADASVVWEGSFAYKGSVVQIDKRQWMRANVHGSLINYSLKNI